MQNVPRISLLTGTNHELADEGSYFTAKNPVAGTGLATIATPTTISDTAPFGVIKGPTTAGKKFRLAYLRLVCTVAGTAGASLRLAIHTDVTKADPTGGTTLVPTNCNQDVPNTIESTFFFGPLAAAAASGAVRELVAPLIKNAIPAPGDIYEFSFGGVDRGISTSAGFVYYGGPPVVIPAGKLASFHLLLPSQSAASSYEVELGGWER
jgi:hypothetical protein